MTDESAAMRAWLDAHGLADAEVLHHLANQDPKGNELTSSERPLLEVRRMVVPGYRPAPADRPPTQDRHDPAEPLGLFDPGPTPPPQRAAVEPTDRHAQRPLRPTARHHGPPSPGQPPAHRDREERER